MGRVLLTPAEHNFSSGRVHRIQQSNQNRLLLCVNKNLGDKKVCIFKILFVLHGILSKKKQKRACFEKKLAAYF